jgi:hypothetical protein
MNAAVDAISLSSPNRCTGQAAIFQDLGLHARDHLS